MVYSLGQTSEQLFRVIDLYFISSPVICLKRVLCRKTSTFTTQVRIILSVCVILFRESKREELVKSQGFKGLYVSGPGEGNRKLRHGGEKTEKEMHLKKSKHLLQ